MTSHLNLWVSNNGIVEKFLTLSLLKVFEDKRDRYQFLKFQFLWILYFSSQVTDLEETSFFKVRDLNDYIYQYLFLLKVCGDTKKNIGQSCKVEDLSKVEGWSYEESFIFVHTFSSSLLLEFSLLKQRINPKSLLFPYTHPSSFFPTFHPSIKRLLSYLSSLIKTNFYYY